MYQYPFVELEERYVYFNEKNTINMLSLIELSVHQPSCIGLILKNRMTLIYKRTRTKLFCQNEFIKIGFSWPFTNESDLSSNGAKLVFIWKGFWEKFVCTFICWHETVLFILSPFHIFFKLISVFQSLTITGAASAWFHYFNNLFKWIVFFSEEVQLCNLYFRLSSSLEKHPSPDPQLTIIQKMQPKWIICCDYDVPHGIVTSLFARPRPDPTYAFICE